MEIAEDQAEKLKEQGAIQITDRFGAQFLLLQGNLFIISSEDTDLIENDKRNTIRETSQVS